MIRQVAPGPDDRGVGHHERPREAQDAMPKAGGFYRV